MDLFDLMSEMNKTDDSPLASRLRPKTLEDIVGQEHILSKDSLLYRAIRADKLQSVIFYGPPGTGKTTLARVIANTTKAEFTRINATTAGKKEMEEAVRKAQDARHMYRRRTILFIDEIHRFNKAQQDFLLPYVEDGTVILIGATTENPFFEVNRALISRSMIFELKPLSRENIRTILYRAVSDTENGLGSYKAVLDEDAAAFLADMAEGDARQALNALELGVLTTERGEDGFIHYTLKVAGECTQKRVLRYDRDGDQHYDIISAFIKSMRGSDPDAAVYYLARMLAAGEDIKFIARRIMICASEDVGLANPMALVVATNAALAVERVGLPESQIILAHAAITVAVSPKSNSVVNAIYAANDAVRDTRIETIPKHLQDAHYKGHTELGRGIGYLYAHDFENHYVEQQYLPDEVKDMQFYIPSENGGEKDVRAWFAKIRPGLWEDDRNE